MKNEEILDLICQYPFHEGKELVPGKAYLFNRNFCVQVSNKFEQQPHELIVLVKDGIPAGGILRMPNDLHWVISEEFCGQRILSSFLRQNILRAIWPQNTSVTFGRIYSRDEYNKKCHLAHLAGVAIRDAEKNERFLDYLDECRLRYNG